MVERRQAEASGRHKDALTRAKVITAAVKIADGDGLEALSLRRLATELGVTPMSLYKHVKDKHEILAEIRNRLLAEIELPPHGDGPGWPQEMRDVLLATLGPLRRHPAIAPLALSGLLDGEAGLELCERLLSLLLQAGFGPEQAAQLSPFVSNAVIGVATMRLADASPLAGGQFGERPPGDLGHLALLDPARFPALRRLADVGIPHQDRAYDERCVDVLVLGLEALAPASNGGTSSA